MEGLSTRLTDTADEPCLADPKKIHFAIKRKTHFPNSSEASVFVSIPVRKKPIKPGKIPHMSSF